MRRIATENCDACWQWDCDCECATCALARLRRTEPEHRRDRFVNGPRFAPPPDIGTDVPGGGAV